MKLSVFAALSLLCASTYGQVHLNLEKIAYRERHPEAVQRLAERNAARRRASNSSVPLSGPWSSLAEYYVSFEIGSPGQHFAAQLDTGSSDFAVPMKGCSSCHNPTDGFWDPSVSSTSKAVACNTDDLSCTKCHNNQCSYTISYADGSGYSAEVFTDDLTFGGFTITDQVIGGISHESSGSMYPSQSFEPHPVDGIMGFAWKTLSEVQAPTPMDNLVAQGDIADIFTVCMTPDSGTLTLGSEGPYHTGTYTYTDNLSYYNYGELWYQVKLTAMSVAGSPIDVSQKSFNGYGGGILDTGTTLMYIPQGAFQDTEKAMQSLCSSGYSLPGVCNAGRNGLFGGGCQSIDSSDFANFPTISLEIDNNFEVTIGPEQYLIQGFCEDSSDYALGIMSSGRSGGFLLGDVFLQGSSIVFDRANNRIGFAPANGCPSATSSQE